MKNTTLTLCRATLPPKVRDAAAHVFVSQFGGYTRQDVSGGWRAPDGTLHVEPMDMWEVATDAPHAWAPAILALAESVGELAVYVTVGGTPQVIETEHAAA